ncbi:hypothetical protein CONCODRAFT_154384 [Conidiobolus coronatus NRRL 28638]|uniref:Uncharacterized protein n=1 Tax=Conidiobolus coronatus (strain ATCC 28846 / CBS 209.66 / NRRL 28638) TaxID=796925 RepID=A0A137P7Z0_CONC2|nr:hypothetical protein CONCODRAFT_154384 [Conidiobolus coronatus NRRL 28638]|eukprot:KXN71041.1 hypothetical protein CONCODRAFT_154384 [Conidiobolus coronatus NRRL 28638]
MRFDLSSANWIPNYVKNQLKLKFPNKVTKTGEYIISSERTRSQFNNLQDCVTKIYEDLLVAAYIPPPPSEETLEKIDKLYTL